MKTPTRQWKRFAKSALVVSMALVASVMVTACGKKKGAAAPPPPAPVGPAVVCPACVAGSQFLLSSLSGVYNMSGQSYIELGLEYYSDGTVTAQSGQDPYTRYSGPAIPHGTMYVSANPTPDLCNIPVGTYELRPYAGRAATLYYDTMHDLVLEAVGPIVIQIHIPRGPLFARTQAQIGKDGKTYPFRMQGYMYMYPQGVQCYGGISKLLE